MMKTGFYLLSALCLWACRTDEPAKIDRYALVTRHNPRIEAFDPLSSLSVGNGNFAFTVDATGLQSYPEFYAGGVPLGTQSQGGWHSFPNTGEFLPHETWRNYDFRGWEEPYAVQPAEAGRSREAADYFRANPHRLHLGYVGLELTGDKLRKIPREEIQSVRQTLNLWEGAITSRFEVEGDSVSVRTAVHPEHNRIAAQLQSPLMGKGKMKLSLRFPYPTGNHTDDASDRLSPQKHTTELIARNERAFVLRRTLDTTVYYVTIRHEGRATLEEAAPHVFFLSPESNAFSFVCEFTGEAPADLSLQTARETFEASAAYWRDFWQRGGAADFSRCTDPRAKELERRVVLSQYLLAIQSGGIYPPQETGLTYNSWFGKFHLEMHWWHAAHFALWNRTDLLERSMDWYAQASPAARAIAERQGFQGIRWMKMTDPSAAEAPSSVGSFLIWQQPHFIYLAELIYRNKPSAEVLRKYGYFVEQTAEFMASFVTFDASEDRYIIKGVIPAQETLRAAETRNPPFELAYWHYGLSTAQRWRERAGRERHGHWDEILNRLSPLAQADSLYLASEDAVDTYRDIRFTSDHPAVLGALGVLPHGPLVQPDLMQHTLDWVWEKWNWEKTWGWDYPLTALCATRLGDAPKAVGALLMEQRTNTYLVNGHNYQDDRLRIYLPGNGGLLTAIALMCAGWDGCDTPAPGFPQDGSWEVMWEGLQPLP